MKFTLGDMIRIDDDCDDDPFLLSSHLSHLFIQIKSSLRPTWSRQKNIITLFTRLVYAREVDQEIK